jgi:hypothetical protein
MTNEMQRFRRLVRWIDTALEVGPDQSQMIVANWAGTGR